MEATMEFTGSERRVLDALSHKRGVVAKEHVACLAGTMGVDAASFNAAWKGLIEKGRLRKVCNESAEVIARG